MKNLLKLYKEYCESKKIAFANYPSVKSWDDSTLFCPAGMQQYKEEFRNDGLVGKTLANNQACLRVNDLGEVGDGSHFAYFNMLGLFSFRDWDMGQAISFWIEFLERWLELKIDYVTLHPNKMSEWLPLYPASFEVVADEGCKWGDGGIEGYCTEFYVNGLEVGNIVRPRGTCIDAGFGLERLEELVNKTKPKDRASLLIEAATKVLEAGFKPGNVKQGYVLRRLLREIYKSGQVMNHPEFEKEGERQERLHRKYLKLKEKSPNQSKEWWWEVHGIEV